MCVRVEAGDVPEHHEAEDPAMAADPREGRSDRVCDSLLHHGRGEGQETEDSQQLCHHLSRHGGHEE